MTREEIMALPAREMDALVAERIMGIEGVTRETPGWERHEINYGGFWYDVDYGDGIVERVSVPCYSTDIAAAWEVLKAAQDQVNKHSTRFWAIEVQSVSAYVGWKYDDASNGRTWLDERLRPISCRPDQVPEAICRMALLAVGEPC